MLLYVGFTLFVVRWNKVNGKAGGLGCFAISATSFSVGRGLSNLATAPLSMCAFPFLPPPLGEDRDQVIR